MFRKSIIAWVLLTRSQTRIFDELWRQVAELKILSNDALRLVPDAYEEYLKEWFLMAQREEHILKRNLEYQNESL